MATAQPKPGRGTFGRLGFIMAAAGSAVGLGNLWKFPYMAHKNGGGSFVLVYLAAALLLGVPIMMAEITLGRRTQSNPVDAFAKLGGRIWSAAGWLGIATGVIILSYYSIVAGWTVQYVIDTIQWSWEGFTEAHAANLGKDFGAFVADGPTQIILHALFMLATAGVIIRGVQKGIEGVTRILMPLLFAILLLLVGVAATTGSFGEAIVHLFTPGPIGANGVLEAVGQAFFSMSLGMGVMITYGSYMDRDASIPRSSLFVGGLDTLIALMASVIMFTVIFSVPEAARAEKFGASASILFTTLPEMLYQLPLGAIITPAFFLLVAFAALTSTISLLEVLVAWFVDNLGWKRWVATTTMALAAFALGVPSALSLGAHKGLSSIKPFGDRATGFFDMMDYTAANILLPLGGLLTAVFVGWFLSEKITREENEAGHGPFALHNLWRLTLRVVCPAAILWILYSVTFLGVKFN